jgi:hypothetical protein
MESTSKKDKSTSKRTKKKDLKDSTPSNPSKPLPTNPEDQKPKKRKREKTDDKEDSKKQKKKKKVKSDTEELEINVNAPNPPSKRAKRLQKKGKEVPRLPSTSQPPPSKTVSENVHPERKGLVKKEIPRAEFGVWIGNLSYKSDVAGLRGWLVRGDKRVTDKEITRMNLPLNADGQSKGYEFCDL